MITTPAMVLTDLLTELARRYGETMPAIGEEIDAVELRAIIDRALARLDETDDPPGSSPV